MGMNKVLRKIAAKALLMPKVKRQFKKIQTFYDRQVRAGDIDWLDIKEAFTESDTKALRELVQMVLKEKVTVVEVGSWKGFSTSLLAKSVVDYHGSVFAVDHWMGNEGTWNYEIAKTYDIYSIFRRNMILLGIWGIVHPLVMDSQTASQIFTDGIVDLVFIDADHRYDSVKNDILSWLPKLKDGGVLCGHDCEGYYSEYSEEDKKMIEQHPGDDCIPTLEDHTPDGEGYTRYICHPGVVKALHDCFHGKYSIMPHSTIWYYIK